MKKYSAMEIVTVSFFGHRLLEHPGEAERALTETVRRLLLEKEYVEFLVGRDGDFDILAAAVVKRCQRELRGDNSALIWVLPYPTADFRDNEAAYQAYYDGIEILQSNGHYKAAIQKRNRAMIDRSDLVICCIEHRSGGAYQSVRYAERCGKEVVNVAYHIEDKG